MRKPALLIVLSLAAIACVDEPPADTGDDSTSSGDGDGDTDEIGDDTTSDSSTTDEGESSETDTSDTETTDSSDTDSSDTSSDECDPWELIGQHVGGMQAPIDCGIVTENEAAAAWQDAHDCALDAVGQGLPFKVMGQYTGIDSVISNAYGAIDGIVYGPVWLWHDTWGPVAEIRNCMAIVAEPDCSVEVGNLCLQCVQQGEPTSLCR